MSFDLFVESITQTVQNQRMREKSHMSFELLAEPIRRFIRNQGWEKLRPIQNAAISRILETESNYILAARTASGKTEAAFLPILSKVNFNKPGVRVLYISPLKALINDQFLRVEELCRYLDVKVTKWHGDAKRSLKQKLVKKPSGIVLITPESIEAMFVNHPYDVRKLFVSLEFVIIDEIHAFIGTDRGIQLKSLISRIQAVCRNKFRVVGLSATIGGYDEAKKFISAEENTKILLDREKKGIVTSFRYFKREGRGLPIDLLKDLYLETKDSKALIFPNSRALVEEVAVRLKKLSKQVDGHANYFSHHSSVDKDVREYVEFFAKESKRENFCISCTSTLELGIDVGLLDQVVQIDSTYSVASLAQRTGRSGRSASKSGKLILYATDPWSLLQSLACHELYKEGFIEPPQVVQKPYDILLHQLLSIVKGGSGISQSELVQQLKQNTAFANIEVFEIKDIIKHLIKIDFLEKLGRELIIGIDGESVVNSHKFYPVFRIFAEYLVVNKGNKIGSVPFSSQLVENENIFLAAKVWKIKSVDHDSMKIEVMAANDGKPPIYSGGFGEIHPRIREKMFEIVLCMDEYEYLTDPAKKALRKLRSFFSNFEVKNNSVERPLQVAEKYQTLYSFTGTSINITVSFLLDIAGIEHSMNDANSSFEIALPKRELLSKWNSLGNNPLSNIDKHIRALCERNPRALNYSKWAHFLPIHYQIKLLKQRHFDFTEALEFISRIKFIEQSERR